jgi:hypothetical protein
VTPAFLNLGAPEISCTEQSKAVWHSKGSTAQQSCNIVAKLAWYAIACDLFV